MFKTVLVPLDGSNLAELALDPALHLARQSQGSVYLMRVPVYADSGMHTSTAFDPVWVEDPISPEYEIAADYIHQLCENINHSDVTLRPMVVEGERASAILNSSLECGADLIAMATHARAGLSRWLFGSVAGKVLQRSYCPVLLLRRPTNLNHMLITLDGSRSSEQIIEPALDFARAFGSRISLLRVDDESALSNKGGVGVQSYLEEVTSSIDSPDLTFEVVNAKGSVAESILTYANQQKFDLIAMSTHGRSGLSRLLYGSVTEKVMRDSACAMLIVRPRIEEER